MYKKNNFKFYDGDIPLLDKDFVKYLYRNRQEQLYGERKFDRYTSFYGNVYRRYKRERDYDFVVAILAELDKYNKNEINNG